MEPRGPTPSEGHSIVHATKLSAQKAFQPQGKSTGFGRNQKLIMAVPQKAQFVTKPCPIKDY